MEKIKQFFAPIVAYCTNEPFHAAIVIGLVALLVLLIIVIAVVSAKYKKAQKASAKETAVQEDVVEEPAPIAEEVAPVAKETVSEKAEEAPMPPEPIQETSIEEKAPVEEEQPAEEKAEPAPAPIVKEKKAEAKPKSEKKIEEKPVQENAVVKTKTPKQSEEKTMLHDELKDVDTDLDFYEENETDQMARYRGKWVLFRIVTEDNESEEMYFFELHASNGEKLLASEEYTTYNGAIRGIETHKNNILKGNFRITLSKKGDYIFKLLSGKNMLLCMGEHYATKARCEAAIESAKRFAKTAIVDENIQDHVVKVPVEDDAPIERVQGNSNGKWIIDCNVSPEGEKVYFFELFANNGERLLSSEEYTTYIGAVNGIQTHKMNIQKNNFRISLTKHGDYIYKLLNSNGQLLCLGEHYKTKRRCQNAVESVKRFAANSPVLTDPELTK